MKVGSSGEKNFIKGTKPMAKLPFGYRMRWQVSIPTRIGSLSGSSSLHLPVFRKTLRREKGIGIICGLRLLLLI